MITVWRQVGIIEIHNIRITRLTENLSKTKYCIKHVENCKKKKKCLNVAQKAEKAEILLKSQESAHKCWRCKIVLQKCRKRAQRNRHKPINWTFRRLGGKTVDVSVGHFWTKANC